MNKSIMAVDIGGTKIKSAIFINEELQDIQEKDTNAEMGGDFVLRLTEEIINHYKKYNFDRIGISTAGQVNSKEGRIIYANENIPGYTGMPVRQLLEEEFKVPVWVENDVNAAAIGEAFYGAGKGESQFACLTYGTGVGGAIFADGRLYSGSSFSAAEFGGIIIHPEKRDAEKDIFSGCYERYASATALVQKAILLDNKLNNGKEIFSRMKDEPVKKIIDDWIDEIIYGLVTVIHMLNPSLVILGGGVMEQDYIIKEIQHRILNQIMDSYKGVKIRKAELGNKAGLLGACAITRENTNGEHKFTDRHSISI